ncbi:hypothetical protein RQP46_001380 [Phenoliferia psychrophenolica]
MATLDSKTAPPYEVPAASTSASLATDEKAHAESPAAAASDDATATTTATETPPPGWTKHYDTIKTKLPAAISSHIPSSTVAASTVDQISTRISTLTATSATQLGDLQRSGSKSLGKLKENNAILDARKRLSPDQFLSCAYSITNSTQIAINVSLNQVGPLMYAVVAPGETFERRVPNVWYSIELRPFTSPETAYNSWSVSWPIIAIAGPVAALASLLLIPIAAVTVGGTALASLTGFGAVVAEGAAGAAAGAGSAAASAGGLAAKLAHLPGGAKIKGKLVDAAKENLGKGRQAVTEGVVRYLGKGVAATAIGGAIGGGAEVKEEERGRAEVRPKEKKKKLDEVEVTGLPLEKVLKCETGKKRTDRSLSDAFKRLNVKNKAFKTKSNPVLRIVGGPELEERGKHSYLVFYPFQLEPIVDVEVEPIPTSEVPPTASESTLIRDALVVESAADAETLSQHVPEYADGTDEKKRLEAEAAAKELEGKKGKSAEGSSSGGGWFGWGSK